LALNPNGKIPSILDANRPDGKPLALFESGAICVGLAVGLAEKMFYQISSRFPAKSPFFSRKTFMPAMNFLF